MSIDTNNFSKNGVEVQDLDDFKYAELFPEDFTEAELFYLHEGVIIDIGLTKNQRAQIISDSHFTDETEPDKIKYVIDQLNGIDKLISLGDTLSISEMIHQNVTDSIKFLTMACLQPEMYKRSLENRTIETLNNLGIKIGIDTDFLNGPGKLFGEIRDRLKSGSLEKFVYILGNHEYNYNQDIRQIIEKHLRDFFDSPNFKIADSVNLITLKTNGEKEQTKLIHGNKQLLSIAERLYLTWGHTPIPKSWANFGIGIGNRLRKFLHKFVNITLVQKINDAVVPTSHSNYTSMLEALKMYDRLVVGHLHDPKVYYTQNSEYINVGASCGNGYHSHIVINNGVYSLYQRDNNGVLVLVQRSDNLNNLNAQLGVDVTSPLEA